LAIVQCKQKRFVFDLETDSLDNLTAGIAGIAFSWQEKEGWYIPINHTDIKLSEQLTEYIVNKGSEKLN